MTQNISPSYARTTSGKKNKTVSLKTWSGQHSLQTQTPSSWFGMNWTEEGKQSNLQVPHIYGNLACVFHSTVLNFRRNGVSVILKQACERSLVILEWYFVLIMLGIGNGDSQLYVQPNIVKTCTATLASSGA